MFAKKVAAAAAALCLMWGTAQAGNENAQPPGAASPVEAPEGVGATHDILILELGPIQGGGASVEDVAAMQMLLLQLLMMQSGAVGGEVLDAPRAASGIGI